MTLVWMTSDLVERLPAPPPGVDVEAWDLGAPVPPSVAEVELFVLPYLGGDEGLRPLPSMARLRVLQTVTAGYDDVLPVVPAGVTLCNAPGVHDASTAELAVTLALAALRGVPDFVRAAELGEWASGWRPALADRRVLVVGHGGVGRAVARRLAGFEVEVVAVARTARETPDGPVHGMAELPALLPAADVVVLCVPLTDETRGLVDGAFLAAMPDGALLVNVARGAVVVTADLEVELRAGRLLAALDVTDPEPLPAGHSLWSAPGLLVSPHSGGDTSAFLPRAVSFVDRQLRRFAAGEALLGVVRPG